MGHPVLALARMGNCIDTICTIAQEARRVSRKIFPVVYTGDGVAVPELIKSYLPEKYAKLRTVRYKRLRDYVLLPDLSLQQFLSVLRESGVLGPRGVIIVCAGLLASRCVNFTDAEYKWSLTHEYYLPAKSTNITELHQGLRVLGNKPWDLSKFKPVVTTKHSVMCNIEIGNVVQSETREKLTETSTLRDVVLGIQLEDKPSVRYAQNMIINSVRVARR